MDHYLPDEQYHRLVEAILTLEPCPFSGEREAYQLRELLGEIGEIWPAECETPSSNAVSST